MDPIGALSHTAPPVEATGIVINRGGNPVLRDVDLALRVNTLVALIGPSGSGKTSLLRVLAQLDKPASGVVRFWGSPPRVVSQSPFIDGRPLYPKLGYVSQTYSLWPHLSIRENLELVRRSASAEEDMDRLCKDFEISEVLDRQPRYASQGQKQRAALVRALLLRPSILLLDEVTAALDERLASRVWDILRGLADAGASILASTHDRRLALGCDYTLRIQDDTVVESPRREVTK